ncbi:citrate/2-methylcitrate synthase, partial [Helicobacter rodentium]
MGTITLINNETGEKFDFDLIECTRGPKAVDFSKLFERTNIFAYDPGYGSTAGCESTISYIDGKNGQLLYKGIPVEEIVEKYKFTDVAKLLITGEAPKNEEESKEFDLELRHRSFLHEGLINIFSAFPDGGHPMANLSSAVAALSTFHFDHKEMEDEGDYQTMARRIIAKITTLVAF